MNRDFKGIWIPREIWLREDLNALDKVIFAEINSLDNENHCTASNEYFADFCKCSESKVSKTVAKLIELGLVEQVAFNGRCRTLKCTKQSSKIYEAECDNLLLINKDSNTNKLFKSKDLNNSKKQSFSKVKEFVEQYNTICVSLPKALTITGKRADRIEKILTKYSEEDIQRVFKNLENSDFCKGKNDRGWRANLDFILREDKFVSVLEGKYNNFKSYNNFGELDTMRSGSYSQTELADIDKLNAERRANGQRTKF